MAAKKDSAKQKDTPRIQNRKAYHDYHITDKLECGIVLLGTEVKSIRAGRVNLSESFARIEPRGGAKNSAGRMELWLYNADIATYENAGPAAQHAARSKRKLLVHRKDIDKLLGKASLKGMSLVPLTMYFNDRGIVKVEIGLGEGKKQHDKREDLKKRDANKDMQRAMSRRRV